VLGWVGMGRVGGGVVDDGRSELIGHVANVK
jgi:hypothetical protein